METYLKRGIKEVIEAHPAVGSVLTRFGIGCVQCTVGTCLLGDVVSIHALPPEDEAELMAEIEQVIYPDRQVERALHSERREALPREITYSPPVRKLVDEHVLIKRLLAVLPRMIEDARATGELHADAFRDAIDFIRGYADRFHHMKEEDILFDYTDREAEVIRVIYEDHDRARAHVRAAAQAIEDGDIEALASNLYAYRELLTEHIAKEDDVLYPYIDRSLTTHQVGEVARRSAEAESKVSADVPAKYERFVADIEQIYGVKETEQCQI
jgi:hemerythrin-like domain-containing protein